MAHLPTLIQDLALILAAAAFVTLVCKWLKQPVVLGYILAGFLVGPHSSFLPTVKESGNISIWAEIGVIFLLFGLGLEFSFRKLAKVGPSASITALVEVISMLGLGYLAGQFLGWSDLDSLFLGGILSISSTTIIIRAFDELGLKSRKFVSLVFGALIIEDLVAILLLVLLSTLAVTRRFEGVALIEETAKLGFFLVLWFVAGIFLVPSFLKKARRFLNDETLVIVSLALCLVMVLLASKAGFSPALGAFIMGSLLAETTEAEKIEHLTRPIKDFFAALFFVSVGMLIDPAVLVAQAGPIFFITILTIFGKSLSTTLGALISGQTLRHSVQSGLSLAQIGEFPFIIASLGLTLKVTSDFLYPIAVAVSAITTLSTPYLIRASDSIADAIEQRIPSSLAQAIHRYSSTMQNTSPSNASRTFVKTRLLRMLVNSIVVIAIYGLCETWLRPFVMRQLDAHEAATTVYAFVTLLLASPFLWAVALGGTQASSMTELIRNARTLGPLIFIEVARFVFALGLVLSFITHLRLIESSLGFATVGLAMAAIFLFWLRLGTVYRWFERRFLTNLGERERLESSNVTETAPTLTPWDAHIAYFKIPQEAAFLGQSLVELGIRERFGVSIALIQRGRRRFVVPSGDEKIYPGDNIGVIGTDAQLEQFKSFIDESPSTPLESDIKDYVLRSYRIETESSLVGLKIRETGLRERAQGMIVGLERGPERILNPDANTQLIEGDLIWVVGDEAGLRQI
jgi:monovalent cation:H+ antiporter-2, CPA2 family